MRPIFETSRETAKLVDLFTEMPIGSTLSFSAASKAAGFPVASTLPAYHSARRIALRDHGVVIEGVRSVGFTRLTGVDMVGKGHRTMKGIRRAARRGSSVAEIAVSQNLPRGEMITVTEQLSRFRIVETTAAAARSNRAAVEKPPVEAEFDSRAALAGLGKP